MILDRYIQQQDKTTVDTHQSFRFKYGRGEVALTLDGLYTPFVLIFRSGDFCVATPSTVFKSKGSVKESFRVKGRSQFVELAKLSGRRVRLSFNKVSTVRGFIKLTLERPLTTRTEELDKYMFIAALLRLKFDVNPVTLMRLRPVANMCGYNVKINTRTNKLRICFGRARRTRLKYIIYPFPADAQIAEYRITDFNEEKIYNNQGFSIA